MGEASDQANASGELDRFDRAIIRILRVDGRISVTALADKVGLTKTPCQVRLKRLQNKGYITGFRAVVNPAKLGRSNVAFIEIKLNDTTEKALRAFDEAARTMPEIEMCHMIAGAFDYLLKVRTADIHEYRRVLGEKISSLPHVSNTSTHVSIQSVVDEAF
ncbi:Lrp/AsnC family leucine-responsive transcriptional regulator [Loktanella ponticola]|uniref:Lrp/AsnC family leucine-responsive transcriptional regulator n=1 Tax=Yoonia ponticola TaxID=1524255 RepID=A0A7W9EYK1_9RHOB|nr:Lrp/AsnC ligand binding domain-containing protein [Yoonia ponticola]MBB5720971.1 Lrp/AsnC family leucine-responsive transcriptional regulator [Yoonia ponticola]